MSDVAPYFNRELSWIEFNRRVLDEARQESVPPLEKIKYLAIVSSNFDEFFMVRVASVRRAVKGGDRWPTQLAETPSQTLKMVHNLYRKTYEEQYQLWDEIRSHLAERGIRRLVPSEFHPEQLNFVRERFQKELFDVLSPVKIEDNRPFPFTGNLRLNLAFLLSGGNPEVGKMIMVEVPAYLDRLVWLPDDRPGASFAFIEDIVGLFVEQLVPGYQIRGRVEFRITRDADIPVDEEKEEDFVEAMARILQNRMHSHPMRLEVRGNNEELINRLTAALDIDADAVFPIPGPLNLKDLFSLATVSGYDELKFPVWESRRPIPDDEDIWEWIRTEDRLLFLPYESFTPVIRLLSEAAVDPDVLAIRMTLYRTSGDSPIVHALAQAAREGKQVMVLVELKARFDEEQNISWARTLEQSGCTVIYGVEGLKVHAKALLIVRRESDGIRRYVHLGTGNYNEKTAKLYGDFGLFTARSDYTFEVAQFFNAITGYSSIGRMHYLVMAPHNLKSKLLSQLEGLTQQARQGVSCRIRAKMNSLADEDIIQALYKASQAGVKILLNVRGICMLVPGKDFSANIHVISIVDRYLEHARVFIFQAGETEEVFLSSADWMFRNLERRVELMFPILFPPLKERIKSAVEVWLKDNVKARVLTSEGIWVRRQPGLTDDGTLQDELRAQEVFHRQVEQERRMERSAPKRDLVARRKPKNS
ncbi:MAG: polyphosphate kinase 1 [Spirochaetales bacterium]|nr:polyphosphate kinase 1 [Spirochaetales bacterium]